jgi:hypothetical protein
MAYDAWKLADGIARAAEVAVQDAWEKFDHRVGAAPSVEMLERAAELRAVATARLREAIDALQSPEP